jgi:phosphomannomutase
VKKFKFHTNASKVCIGIVGGSDLQKQKHQLGETVHEDFDYIFSQNGLEAYKGKDLIAKAVKLFTF